MIDRKRLRAQFASLADRLERVSRTMEEGEYKGVLTITGLVLKPDGLGGFHECLFVTPTQRGDTNDRRM